MAHHESAKKRMRQDARRKAVNRAVKSEIKSVTKRVAAAGPENTEEALREAASVIDRAAKKRVIHWKTAARKKSRMARRARARMA